MEVIEEGIARRTKIFRACEVKHRGVSPTWLSYFEAWGSFSHRGLGVWTASDYKPSRYERVQIRFPRAVFCGASALWLLGELAKEPEELWIAIDNKARPPRTIDSPTVIVRTRRLEDDVVLLQPADRELTLRVREAAHARLEMTTGKRIIRKAAPTFIRWDPTKLPRALLGKRGLNG